MDAKTNDRTSRRLRITATVIAMAGWCVANGNGAVVINVTESGGNVVAVGSGSLNTAGLSIRADQGLATGTNPAFGFIGIGAGIGDYYETIFGPELIGPGSSALANTGTGDKFGFGDRGTWLLVPEDYISGSALSGTATWMGTTIAGLGLDPGTYLWTWGAGATADSLTLNIGTVVPETSSAALFGIGVAACAFRRRRASSNLPV